MLNTDRIFLAKLSICVYNCLLGWLVVCLFILFYYYFQANLVVFGIVLRVTFGRISTNYLNATR